MYMHMYNDMHYRSTCTCTYMSHATCHMSMSMYPLSTTRLDRAQVLRKLTTFGAANRFGDHAEALDPSRIEACRRDCVELLALPDPRAASGSPAAFSGPTPCLNESELAGRIKRRAQGNVQRRVLPPSYRDDSRSISPAVLQHTFRDHELPSSVEAAALPVRGRPQRLRQQQQQRLPLLQPLPPPPRGLAVRLDDSRRSPAASTLRGSDLG